MGTLRLLSGLEAPCEFELGVEGCVGSALRRYASHLIVAPTTESALGNEPAVRATRAPLYIEL